MSRTYRATGINLKSMPMGETDRLLTVLTREFGLVRLMAMGSRKHNSSLAGRSSLFVVNDLLIARGRSLDKLTQAETLESYPGLSQDLRKLTASQYLAELCLYQALSDQPQEELFCLLNEHLKRLEQSDGAHILPHLTHAVFQLLILAGIAPQVHVCCISRQPLTPDIHDPAWRIGFSIPSGGTVTLEALERLKAGKQSRPGPKVQQPSPLLHTQMTAPELDLLQRLAQAELPNLTAVELADTTHGWRSIERVLRYYAQYHLDCPIRSATLVDVCFASPEYPQPS